MFSKFSRVKRNEVMLVHEGSIREKSAHIINQKIRTVPWTNAIIIAENQSTDAQKVLKIFES